MGISKSPRAQLQVSELLQTSDLTDLQRLLASIGLVIFQTCPVYSCRVELVSQSYSHSRTLELAHLAVWGSNLVVCSSYSLVCVTVDVFRQLHIIAPVHRKSCSLRRHGPAQISRSANRSVQPTNGERLWCSTASPGSKLRFPHQSAARFPI